MLGCDNGFDNRGEIVDIGQRFHTENYVVVRIFTR
jgi:hypothetical protein